MFLKRLSSDDERFKDLTFHEGMNLVLAEKTQQSNQTNSRNGVGKSSIIRILRFLMGGNNDNWIKSLSGYLDGDLQADLCLGREDLHVERALGSTEVIVDRTSMNVNEWQMILGKRVLGFDADHKRPTTGEIFAQLIRNDFGSPTKIHSKESDIASGTRIGYLLGMSDDKLCLASKAKDFESDKKALKKAVEHGTIGNSGPSKSECESELLQLI